MPSLDVLSMRKKINLHQQAADKMQAKIMQAAQTLFIEKGFSGTSIGSIAKEAEINQSLVYHYFESKEDLWRQTKALLIQSTLGGETLLLPSEVSTLDDFLNQFLVKRFTLYGKNRNLMRMLMWQALEENVYTLAGISGTWKKTWLQTIAGLQSKGSINLKFTPDEIYIWINGVIWAPFISGVPPDDVYCEKMRKELKRALK